VSNTYTNSVTKYILSVSNAYTNGTTLSISKLEQSWRLGATEVLIINKIENNFVANPYKFKIVEVGILVFLYGKVNL